MRTCRSAPLLLTSLFTVLFALACADGSNTTSLPSLSRSDAGPALIIEWDPYHTTAPYTWYCLGYYGISKQNTPCSGDGGATYAPLGHPNLQNYCGSQHTAEYCMFDNGGTGQYTDASPYHLDEFNDAGPEMTPLPDCTQYQPNAKVKAWCKGTTPAVGTARYNNLQLAITKIKDTPDPYCQSIGAEAQRLFNDGLIRVYPSSELPNVGGFAPNFKMGTADAYIAISDQWIDLSMNDNHSKKVAGNKVTLQLVLAHELDHLWGISGHLSETKAGKLFTTFTERCSGQGAPKGII